MKLIVSSKTLASQLSLIDFNKESVNEVSLEKNTLKISTQTQTVQMFVDKGSRASFFKTTFEQVNTRWDWIKDLVSKVEEQPIVLEIQENSVNVIFQY